jgi:hypothetical protein
MKQEDYKIKCIICETSVDCSKCEFNRICEQKDSTSFCICKTCSKKQDIYNLYVDAIKRKFPSLKSTPKTKIIEFLKEDH